MSALLFNLAHRVSALLIDFARRVFITDVNIVTSVIFTSKESNESMNSVQSLTAGERYRSKITISLFKFKRRPFA
ncbi:unnamed protein product [Parnassius mnemosyne]|uniref:Secreted protein n=1 Tax=Parnassius mnemosyne TaxID=213953 RepID=A0AAV1M5R8_9NEOP